MKRILATYKLKYILLLFLCIVLCGCLFAVCGCRKKQPTSISLEDGTNHQHVYNELVSTVTSTCTKQGSKTYRCVCGETFVEYLPLASHEFNKFVYDVEKHCVVCAVCNAPDPNSTQEGHSYTSETVVELKCTQDGVEKYICKCGYSYTETTLSSGHQYDRTKYSRYTESSHYYKCRNCDDEIAEQHAYAITHNEPNCVDDGLETYLCDCGYNYSEIIDALGHDARYFPAKDARPSKDGNAAYWKCVACSRCFSSQSCQEELTIGQIVIPAPETHLTSALEELLDIALDNYVGEFSEDYYEITLTVVSISLSTQSLKLVDVNDDFISIDVSAAYDLTTIIPQDTVTVIGNIRAKTMSSMEFGNVQILSVQSADVNNASLFVDVYGATDGVNLTVSSNGVECQCILYGAIQTLYSFNSLTIGDSLTIRCETFAQIGVISLVINGKPYDLVDGEITIEITDDVNIEIIFA